MYALDKLEKNTFNTPRQNLKNIRPLQVCLDFNMSEVSYLGTSFDLALSSLGLAILVQNAPQIFLIRKKGDGLTLSLFILESLGEPGHK